MGIWGGYWCVIGGILGDIGGYWGDIVFFCLLFVQLALPLLSFAPRKLYPLLLFELNLGLFQGCTFSQLPLHVFLLTPGGMRFAFAKKKREPSGIERRPVASTLNAIPTWQLCPPTETPSQTSETLPVPPMTAMTFFWYKILCIRTATADNHLEPVLAVRIADACPESSASCSV